MSQIARNPRLRLLISVHYKFLFSDEYVGPGVARGRINANPF